LNWSGEVTTYSFVPPTGCDGLQGSCRDRGGQKLTGANHQMHLRA